MNAGVTVTVIRLPGRDRHGDPTGPPAEHDVAGCAIAPRSGDGSGSRREDLTRGEVVIVGLTVYAPFRADIRSTDQIRITDPAWAGTYDVVGEPGRWQSPFSGAQPGLEVALVRHG